MLLSLVMVDQLLRRRRTLVLPKGFALWALFLAWVALGVLVLWADAPGAVPGGGASRLAVFAYRGAWYFTGTVMMLWVANLRESELSTRWLCQLLGFMFVVTTVGGMAGMIFPTFEFRSLVELLLPSAIRSNNLVQSMTHPAVADIQYVLGRLDARPRAPFAFANTWGSSLALYAPFFAVSWWRDGATWQRLATPVVLLVASVPIVYSLNRGLWICLAVGALGLVALQVRKARVLPILVALGLLSAVTVAFMLSPLATIFHERLQHAHSNERRAELLSQTVASTVQGSPVIGFGSTRDVQGNFTSIAGADTPDCSACGVPPLGTQGHLWMVIFSQGLVGAALFLAFFLTTFQRTWRCRTTVEAVATFVLVFFFLQLFIYDTLGSPLITVMITVGLAWREQWASEGLEAARRHASSAVERLKAAIPFLLALILVGAVLGAGVGALKPSTYATRVTLLVNQMPVHLDAPDADAQGNSVPPVSSTVDTEAAVITSTAVLRRVINPARDTVDRLRRQVLVTAAANTRVVFVDVRSTSPDRSHRLAVGVAKSYIDVRDATLVRRRDAALKRIHSGPVRLSSSAEEGGVLTTAQALSIRDAVLAPTTAATILRTGPAREVRKQPEVLIASGAALGLALGALIVTVRPNWTVRKRRRGGPW